MSEFNGINFPAITEGWLGGSLTQTVDARHLHAFLKNGDHFSTWAKDRIRLYRFTEGVDFTTYSEVSEKGGAPRTEYAISLDMAKELGMVERNEMGRLVRQYFIQCERQAKATHEAVQAAIANQLQVMLPALVNAEMATRTLAIRRGRTAGQIWKEAGFPPIRMGGWFGNRLREVGCGIAGDGRGELGLSTARLYDLDRATTWLRNGGRMMVETKLAERMGQGKLRLVQPAHESHGH